MLIYILAQATYLIRFWYFEQPWFTPSICLLCCMTLPYLWSLDNLIVFVLLFFSQFLEVHVSLVSSFNFVLAGISSTPLNPFPT